VGIAYLIGNFHTHRDENLKFYKELTAWALERRRNVSPVRHELGFYIPEDRILHGHRRENLNSYKALTGWVVKQKGCVS
jgi:hypothetical protein